MDIQTDRSTDSGAAHSHHLVRMRHQPRERLRVDYRAIPHLTALVSSEGLSSEQAHELARLWLNLSMRKRPGTAAQWHDLYMRVRKHL